MRCAPSVGPHPLAGGPSEPLNIGSQRLGGLCTKDGGACSDAEALSPLGSDGELEGPKRCTLLLLPARAQRCCHLRIFMPWCAVAARELNSQHLHGHKNMTGPPPLGPGCCRLVADPDSPTSRLLERAARRSLASSAQSTPDKKFSFIKDIARNPEIARAARRALASSPGLGFAQPGGGSAGAAGAESAAAGGAAPSSAAVQHLQVGSGLLPREMLSHTRQPAPLYAAIWCDGGQLPARLHGQRPGKGSTAGRCEQPCMLRACPTRAGGP